MAITEQQISQLLRKSLISALARIMWPAMKREYPSNDFDVSLDIVLGYPAKSVIEGIRNQVVDKLKSIPGMGNVSLMLRARSCRTAFNGESSSFPE